MPLNLIAICGRPGTVDVKRVRVSADVQSLLEGFFNSLEAQFRSGIENESPYDSRWIPNSDEFATLPVNSEVTAIRDALVPGVLSLPELNTFDFENEDIRALAVWVGSTQRERILFQAFSAQQRLSRRVAFISKNNVFEKLDQSAFSLTNQIDIIVENNLIKFTKFNLAKRIFDLSSNYREASEAEIKEFCSLPIFEADVDDVLKAFTQPIKKLISSIQESGILHTLPPREIAKKAAGLIDVDIKKGKIVLPSSKKELKDLLTLLDHGIYRSPMNDDTYETNSRRKRP